MPTALCFGDSNTYGTLPMRSLPTDKPRLAQRWPLVLGESLKWDVIEEGLPGRTFAFPDPIKGPHMDGRLGLFMALESHGPIDALLIMLGTNDCKSHFDAAPEEIAGAAGFYLDVALSEDMQSLHGGFEPFLILPPAPRAEGVLAEQFEGSASRFEALRPLLLAQAEARDVAAFDAGSVVAVSAEDGVHLDARSHADLGAGIAAFMRSEIEG